MATLAESASRLTPCVQEALGNEEVKDQIRRGAGRLRAAYSSVRKRRLEAARNEKVRRQAKEGALVLKGQSFEGGDR
ncbi:MAG: hypothetical protein ACRDLL_08985 [Solirubrobacterales bacterium]